MSIDEKFQALQAHPQWKNLTMEGKDIAARRLLAKSKEYQAAKGEQRRAMIDHYVMPLRRNAKAPEAQTVAGAFGEGAKQGFGATLGGALSGMESDLPSIGDAISGLTQQGLSGTMPRSAGEAARTVAGTAGATGGQLLDPASLGVGIATGGVGGHIAGKLGAKGLAQLAAGGATGGAAIGGAIPAVRGGSAADIAQGAALGGVLGAAGGWALPQAPGIVRRALAPAAPTRSIPGGARPGYQGPAANLMPQGPQRQRLQFVGEEAPPNPALGALVDQMDMGRKGPAMPDLGIAASLPEPGPAPLIRLPGGGVAPMQPPAPVPLRARAGVAGGALPAGALGVARPGAIAPVARPAPAPVAPPMAMSAEAAPPISRPLQPLPRSPVMPRGAITQPVADAPPPAPAPQPAPAAPMSRSSLRESLGLPPRDPMAGMGRRPGHTDIEPPWWDGTPEEWAAMPKDYKEQVWTSKEMPDGFAPDWLEQNRYQRAMDKDFAHEEYPTGNPIKGAPKKAQEPGKTLMRGQPPQGVNWGPAPGPTGFAPKKVEAAFLGGKGPKAADQTQWLRQPLNAATNPPPPTVVRIPERPLPPAPAAFNAPKGVSTQKATERGIKFSPKTEAPAPAPAQPAGAAKPPHQDPEAIARGKEMAKKAQEFYGPNLTSGGPPPASAAKVHPIRVEEVPVGRIGVDPASYQFRQSVSAKGVDNRMAGIQEWDAEQASRRPVTLHEREDGGLYVVDGHHRVDLAKRLEAEGKPVPPLLAQIYREVDGFTVADMRRKGALANIMDGSGEAVDVARVLRSGPLSEAESRKMGRVGNTALQDGEALAKLNDEAFHLVLDGKIRPDFAAIVAREIRDPRQQVEAMQDFVKRPPAGREEAMAIAQEMNREGFSTVTQMGLFGEETRAASLARPIAEIATSVKRAFREDKGALGSALRNKGRLEQRGNKIDSEATAAAAQDLAALDNLFETEARLTGDVGEALRAAARDYSEGRIGRETARNRVIDAMVGHLEGLKGAKVNAAEEAPAPPTLFEAAAQEGKRENSVRGIPGQPPRVGEAKGALPGALEGLAKGESGQATPAGALLAAGATGAAGLATTGHPVAAAILAGGAALLHPRVRGYLYRSTPPAGATFTPALEALGVGRKAGMLGNPATIARNEASNAAWMAFDGATRPIQAAADAALGILTGRRTVQGADAGAVVRAGQQAWQNIRGDVVAIMRGQPRNAQQAAALGAWQDNPVVTHFPILDDAINGTFRLQAAADVPFRRYAYHRSIEEQASLMAREWAKGQPTRPTGASIRAYRDHLRQNPSAAMEAEAAFASEYAAFQDPTILGEKAEALRGVWRGKGPAGTLAADIAIPFAKTPGSVTTRIARLMIPGAPINVAEAIGAKMRGTFSAQDQRMLAQAMGRNVGAMALMYLGYKYGSEWLTAPYDPERAPLDSAEGRQASSMRVGDRWVKIGNLGPAGALLIIGAGVREGAKERGTFGKASKVGKLAAEALGDTPMVEFSEDIAHFFKDPVKGASSAAGNLAGSFVPGAVAQVAQMTDNKERQRDPGNPLTTAQSRIPGLRESLPEKVSGRGRTPEQTIIGTKATDTPATRELRRLNIPLSAMPKTLDVGKRKSGERFMLSLPMELQQGLYRAQQRATIKALEHLVTRAAYARASDDAKAAAIRKKMAITHEQVLEAWKAKHTPELKAAIKEQRGREAASPPDRSAP